MPTAQEVAVASAARALGESLPLGGDAHVLSARLWLGGEGEPWLDAAAALGTWIAVAVLERRPLVAALGDGLRGVSRPDLFRTTPGGRSARFLALAVLAMAAVALPLSAWASALRPRALLTGGGLLLTAALVIATRLAPPPARDAPGALASLAVGAASGLGALPGVSPVAVSLTLLLLVGTRPERAVHLALALALPWLLAHAVGAALRGAAGVRGGDAALALAVALGVGALGVAALRRATVSRRLPLFALWLVPLGAAWLALAHAVPEG